MNVYGVTFKDKGKIYYFNGQKLRIPDRVTVIVETEKGLQFGRVVKKIDLEQVNIDTESLRLIVRIATKKDYEQYLTNLRDAELALRDAKNFSKELELQMNFIDASFTFDRKQLLFNFYADNRVDFRELAKKIANDIFTILAKAEAKAHGVSIEDVHFHEVGAVDSIVDIVAVAVCIDNLNIDEVIVSPLYEGTGFIRCQHGVIPVPVPAVCEIVRDNDIDLKITNYEGEFVTPTGAAIVAAIKTSDKLPDKFTIENIGIGAGKREYEKAGILRAMIIKDTANKTHNIYKLESNIDDCSGEVLGYVVEKLLSEGARDVHFIPVFMKKNRPAYQLNVICREEDIEKFEQIIFEETTTIGIRKQKMKMTMLKTELKIIDTYLGKAQVKICDLKNEKRIYPEYNSIVEICEKSGKSYQEIYQFIVNEYKKLGGI